MTWLATPEGPTLVEGQATDSDSARCLAIYLTPRLFYGEVYNNSSRGSPDEASSAVGVGVVYKPQYVHTTPFSKALALLLGFSQVGRAKKGYPSEEQKLTSDCVLLLAIRRTSLLIPRAKPYPTFLDYASRDLLQSGGEFTTNYRAFHTYVVSYEDGATPGKACPCVFLPRCHDQGATVISVDPSRRPDEALENAPKSEAGGNRRIGMRVEAPNNQHWGLTGDGQFVQFLATLTVCRDSANALTSEATRSQASQYQAPQYEMVVTAENVVEEVGDQDQEIVEIGATAGGGNGQDLFVQAEVHHRPPAQGQGLESGFQRGLLLGRGDVTSVLPASRLPQLAPWLNSKRKNPTPPHKRKRSSREFITSTWTPSENWSESRSLTEL